MPSMQSQSLFVAVGPRFSLKPLCLIAAFVLFFTTAFAPAQQNPQYGSMSACNGVQVGTPATQGAAGGGALNGFVPFPSTNAWNTNIYNAPVDPNSAALMSTFASTTPLHDDFGSGANGIPYIVVDSTITPLVPINVIANPSQSDVVIAPFTSGTLADQVPIQGFFADCSGWPDSYQGDAHALVIDRAACWAYETYNTNRCNGMFDADNETIWDMVNYNQRPWGWASADEGGLSVFAGLVKYDEAASGVINHAFRFTMENTEGDSNGGYFVLPASHAASSNTATDLMPEGARLRLRSNVDITAGNNGQFPVNEAILTALQQYGMILAENGNNLYFQGTTDARWNASSLSDLTYFTAADFDVIQMTPEYPGMDATSAPTDYPGILPVIDSFTATDSNSNPLTNVQPGDAITFNSSVSGETYDYIDNISPLRLTVNGGGLGVNTGSVTITPTETQEYTLYSTNASGRVSNTIQITMPSTVVAPPVFTPAAQVLTNKTTYVGISTPTSPKATIYYTLTNGATGTAPTTASTLYVGSTGVNVDHSGATQTLEAIAVVNGYAEPSEPSSATYPYGTATAKPTFSPAGGTYSGMQTVTISDTTAGAVIYYTTDGTTPIYPIGGTEQLYSTPIAVSAAETLKAIAVAPGYGTSAVGTAAYTFKAAATPTFSPAAGTLTYSAGDVTISDTTAGATIYYTVTPGTTGTAPTTSSSVYTGPITVSANSVVDAIAVEPGYSQSGLGSAKYTMATAATPTFTPVAGSYTGVQTVTISDTTPGKTIYYTVTSGATGTAPTTSSTVYTGPITVSAPSVVEAIATSFGYANSAAGSAKYTFTAAPTPGFSPAAGGYTTAQTVTITDSNSSATINYTVTAGATGTAPTTNSSVYTGPITVSASSVVEAMAVVPGYSNSAAGSAKYTLTVATPTFTPIAGNYTGAQTVTISDTTPGATIHYTITAGATGTAPTTASAQYTGPVIVSASSVVEAIGVEAGFSNSAAGSAKYTLAAAATPTFTPAAGGYTTTQTVTISDATAGSTIYYTITAGATGTAPTTNSTVYTGPVTVSASSVVEAIAIAYGYSTSAAGSAKYTLTVATPTFTPVAGNYTGAQTVTISDTNPGATIYFTITAGATGTVPTTASTLYTGPVTVSASSVVEAIGVAAGYSNSAAGSAKYTLAAAATPTFTPAAGGYTTTQTVTISDATAGATIYYTITAGTAGTAPTTASTVYTGPVTVSASSVVEAIATAYGYSTSAAGSAKYTLTVATPTFSPAAGGYTTAQTVTISDTNPSATIYYTVTAGTTGTAPTTSSTLYTGPVTVSATSVVEAIGVATGYSNSAAGSAKYTLTVATPTFSPVAGGYIGAQTVTISDANPSATIYYTVTAGTAGTTPTTNSTVYTGPITVSASSVVEAIGVSPGYSNSAAGSAKYTLTVATPTFSPVAGGYIGAQTVTISDTTPGATVYYTVTAGTAGTTPTTNSTVYTGPITVSASSVVEAIAVSTGDTNSAAGSAKYTLTVATPTFSPGAGIYTSVQSVSISDTSTGAAIYYTTNGTSPTTGSMLYSGAIIVSSPVTLEAIAVVSGYTTSATGSATYAFTVPSAPPVYVQQCSNGANGASTLSCTLNGVTAGDVLVIGVYGPATLTSVTASTATPALVISNGYGENAYLLPNAASGSITITANQSGSTPYWLSVVEYTNVLPSPLDTSASGYNSGSSGPTISTSNFSTTASADMLWSMCEIDAGTLTAGTAPFAWTLRATAPTGDPDDLSPIIVEDGAAGAAGTYYGQCAVTGSQQQQQIVSVALLSSGPVAATPTFSPVAGSYNLPQTVTISTTTPSANIYYTTDGTTPTYPITGTTQLYSGAITVSAWETVNAIATSAGYANSAVGSAAYAIGVATPTFSPGGGSYIGAQTVTIGDSTLGAAIYYTTNGTTPTTNSTPYSGAITVSASETVEAIATAGGYANSAVGSAVYAIAAATPTFSPIAGTYTGAQSLTISSTTPLATIYYTTDGSTPTTSSTSYSGAITVSTSETVNAIAAATGDANSAVGSAVYTIVAATPTFSPGTGSYYTAPTVTISTTSPSANIYYTTDGSTPTYPVTGTTQLYSGPITVSASATVNAIAAASGYANSAVGSAVYTLLLSAPTFSPGSGSYNTALILTLSDANPGASIYFTEDGSTPTTNSLLYSPYYAPINTIYGSAAPTTVNAIAVEPGYTNSAVSSATYNIPVVQPLLTTPAPSTRLTSTSVTFAWTTGTTAIHYEFWVGNTGPGSSNLYNSGNVTATSATVNVPATALTVYARLYWLVDGYLWQETDYTYTASGTPTQAAIQTPTPGSQLQGTSEAFTWTTGVAATQYILYAGTTGPGSSNLYNSESVTATTETVSDLPSNGETVNVRLYSLIYGAWQYTDYTYKASGAPIAATLTTPTPDTTTQLPGTSVAFAWNPGNLATQFQFWVGTTGVGSSNLYNSGPATATTETVSNLPDNDSTFYVRLYSLINGAWQETDYTYISAGTATQGTLTTPTPDTSTPLSGTSVTFAWTPGNSATHFILYVGSAGAGSSNLYNSGNVTATSETVNDLPSNGQTLNVRLYSLVNGAWLYTDYTYVLSGSPIPASLTTPTPDTTTQLPSTSVAFAWNPGNSATQFEFWVGTTGPGSSNLYNSGPVTATTETVSDLPNNDSTFYVRLYSLIDGAWHETDYTYISAGTATQGTLTTPTPDTSTPLSGTSVTFAWTPGNSATHFELWVGTSGAGSSNLYNSGNVAATSETVSDLPSNGATVNVRLYSLVNGAWLYTDYTYVAY